MKIKDIYESTTAGSIATVSAPMTTQSRNASIYGGKKVGNLLTGKKTNKKYANSVNESAPGEKGVNVVTINKNTGQKFRTGILDMEGALDILRKAKARGDTGYIVDHETKKRIDESKMKELAMDKRNMDNGNFQKKYKKSKEQMKLSLGDPDTKKTVHESRVESPGGTPVKIDPDKFYVWAWDGRVVVYGKFDTPDEARKQKYDIEDKAIKRVGPYVEGQFRVSAGDDLLSRYVNEAKLDEDDVIIVPGQGRSRKTGFIKHGESRLDHEVEMARSDLFSAAKNAKQVYEMIQDVSEEEGLEGWVQEKIIKANDYLNTIREYLEGKQLPEMTGGVIAGGGVGEGTVLGRGMSSDARARDVDQSDIEYIEQREFKDQWKQENPGKKWPGYDEAGFKSRYGYKER
jgi:hypothetical protein